MTAEIFVKEESIEEQQRHYSHPFREINSHRNKHGFFINSFDLSFASEELKNLLLTEILK